MYLEIFFVVVPTYIHQECRNNILKVYLYKKCFRFLHSLKNTFNLKHERSRCHRNLKIQLLSLKPFHKAIWSNKAFSIQINTNHQISNKNAIERFASGSDDSTNMDNNINLNTNTVYTSNSYSKTTSLEQPTPSI